MVKVSVILVLCICLGAGLVIAGCTQQASTTTPATTATPAASENQAGMANPASVNCGNIGGTTEIKTSADGSQYGMCTFTNGTTCEEWALFRGEGCQAGPSVNQTPAEPASNQTGLANPASVNCVNIGGKVEIKDSAAGQYGMCTVHQWHHLRGVGAFPR